MSPAIPLNIPEPASATSLKSNDTPRLLSPPISPDRPTSELCEKEDHSAMDGQSRAYRNAISKQASSMFILPYRKGFIKADCLKVLDRYKARMDPQFQCKTRKFSPRVSRPFIPTTRNRTYNSEDEKESSATPSLNQSNYVLSESHTYATRSRKNKLSVGDSQSLRLKAVSYRDSIPRALSGASKFEFLQTCDVHMIHDMPINDVPDFIPPMEHITRDQIEKQVKRIGFSLSHPLKYDAYVNEVPEREVSLVAAFKLSPLQYLDNKKRFFAEKARKTQLGSTFKKTDAQKACAIDVNKASKLYEVFDHMGLLKDSLFSERV